MASIYLSTCTRLLTVGLAATTTVFSAQPEPLYEQAPIHYSRSVPQDEVAQLLKRIAAGLVKFSGSDNDVLRTILGELKIPVESQILVFSKTSLQGGLIQPNNPRAVFFSDSAYAGFVPGGIIEVAAIDPELGPVFYSVNPDDALDARRTFVRETSCLRCHGGTLVPDTPGLLARTTFTAKTGEPLRERDVDLVNDQTPFERRWGGWYVTGYTGKVDHRGNAFSVERGDEILSPPSAERPQDISGFTDPAHYLAPTSDVAALLVFQHQVAMHNILTRSAHDVRRALQGAKPEAATPVISRAADDIVDGLLFRNAAPLPDGVNASPQFVRAFTTSAHHSRHGDSLKDLSLQGRLFRNRCSFLVDSETFRTLPAPLLERVLAGLELALRDENPDGRYGYLENDEKRRILEILGELFGRLAPTDSR